jgi:hypothetical protein
VAEAQVTGSDTASANICTVAATQHQTELIDVVMLESSTARYMRLAVQEVPQPPQLYPNSPYRNGLLIVFCILIALSAKFEALWRVGVVG